MRIIEIDPYRGLPRNVYRRNGRFMVRIWIDSRCRNVGTFDTLAESIAALLVA